MEEMEPITTQAEPEEAKPEPSRWYEGRISLEDAKTFIKSNITTAARSFIAIGFYLKCVRDRELFLEENYGTVWDFAKEEYGISKSTASRYMSMNDRFSENGNSPNVQEEYRAFDKSKLQEMLYLEDEQLKQVTPEYRVEDIRNLRKPKEIPYIELPGQMDFEIDFPDILPMDQMEQLVPPQKQIFEMRVEDMLSGDEQESIAISQQEQGEKFETNVERNPEFSIAPTGCLYRTAYSCTIPAKRRAAPGDGYNCGSSCCWLCKFHGACKLECSASAGRDGALPEYDAAWFVKQWAKKVPEEELEGVLKACRESSNNADRAKAVQKEISPYGAYSQHCWEYNFSFHGFAGGMDFRIGKVEMHLKYGRFVQELSVLYPDFEEPEKVPKQSESVLEAPETVIDGNFVEILSEQELSARSILEEEKAELHNWIEAFKGEEKELPPAVERRKIIVAALAAMVCKLETVEQELVKPEQPELPILKNNEQRAAFIDAYETWPIWIETKETGERYYRYDLPDGTSIVVKVYRAKLFDYKTTGKKYEDRYYEGYGRHEYYFLKEGQFFRDCETNKSYLVEKLKELQKKKES